MIRPLAQLEAGMVLKEAVRDLSGRLLLAAGEAITAKHLRTFRTWGVAAADVCDTELPKRDDHPLDDLRARQPERFQAAETRLRERFRCANEDHPLMAELFAWWLARELEREA